MPAEEVQSEPDTVVYGGQKFTPAPTRRRGRETVRDMVISMGVVGLGVAALMLVAWRPTPEAAIRTVDWQTAAVGARTVAEYPVLVPTGLPEQWKATSARFESDQRSSGRRVWHVGFVTPGNAYAGLEQTDADPAVFVARVVEGGRPEGEVTINGRQWQVYGPGANGYRSLVLAAQGSTVVVTGSAERTELEQLAASLTPS